MMAYGLERENKDKELEQWGEGPCVDSHGGLGSLEVLVGGGGRGGGGASRSSLAACLPAVTQRSPTG